MIRSYLVRFGSIPAARSLRPLWTCTDSSVLGFAWFARPKPTPVRPVSVRSTCPFGVCTASSNFSLCPSISVWQFYDLTWHCLKLETIGHLFCHTFTFKWFCVAHAVFYWAQLTRSLAVAFMNQCLSIVPTICDYFLYVDPVSAENSRIMQCFGYHQCWYLSFAEICLHHHIEIAAVWWLQIGFKYISKTEIGEPCESTR